VATGLSAGTYTLTVTDSQGCQGIVTVTITQPLQVGGNNTTTGTACSGNTGTATETASGGTGPYTYSWATSPSQTGATATGLSTGIYTVFITDANGCTGTDTAIVNSTNGPTATIQNSANPLCNGGLTGTATATATGGSSPYTYSWLTSPAQTSATATGLGAGTYTVIVTDANGCSSIVTVTLNQPAAVSGTTVQTNVQCFGGNNGASTATGSGGTGPYTYVWNTAPAQSGATASGLTAGNYSVTVTDANGCTNVIAVTITEPPSPADTLAISGAFCPGDSAAMLYAPAGFGNYQWYFDNVAVSGANEDSLFILNTSSYTGYTVTWMLNGCVRTTSFINLSTPAVLFTPDSLSNVFTPNNDGKNDLFTPYSGKIPSERFITYYAKDFTLHIYNRWGNLVFTTSDIKTLWDGTNDKGKEVPAGTYYWISTYISRCDPSENQVTNKGFVQLLR
jgi:gliding motility-associated-like protein